MWPLGRKSNTSSLMLAKLLQLLNLSFIICKMGWMISSESEYRDAYQKHPLLKKPYLKTLILTKCLKIWDPLKTMVVIKGSFCQCRRYKRYGFDPWSERSPGGGNGKPLQYSCLENSLDRGAWWAAVHRVTKSRTQLSTTHRSKPCLKKTHWH